MGKPFEITYAPDSWNAPAGTAPNVWASPYGGLHVQAPENMISPAHSPALNNILLRNAELRSRPAFKQLLRGPDGNNFVLACGSFLSNNHVYHTFCMTQRGLFQLKPNSLTVQARGENPWIYLGGPSLSTAPLSWANYAGVLYYGNGAHLSAWDGAANTPITDVAFTGAVSPAPSAATVFGGVFLGELDNHILLANVTETTSSVATPFPTRIRWSNNGFNPTTAAGVFGGNLGTIGATFDPTININAGLNDFLDCPDLITGLMTLGRVGYLFRQNGVTEITPTGKGIAPFDFNHLWASQNGIGNVYPFTIAQYGNMGVFISFEQIYQITPGGMQPIGGGARDSIMADLAKATGSPKASIDRGFKLGYSYLTYHLRIPTDNQTVCYMWSQEDGNWTRWTHANLWPTGISNECWI